MEQKKKFGRGANQCRRAVIDKGGEAEIIFVADTFDPLRKRYPFLPKEYEEYVGMPLSEIPDPEGCHESYAEHFLQPFLESLEILNIPVKVEKADKMYKEGRYEEVIKIALERKDKIAKIIEEVTGRKLEDDWSPFMPLCEECGRINTTKVVGFDDKWIYYRCECGNEGKVSYKGGGKLTWRVDWAARWKILGVTCEPFGKDHAAAGGSYDTGKRLAREIFGIEPPYPIPYEWIHLKGVGAMSSSKGIVIPVREFLNVLPPEIVRYIIIRSKPKKHIDFDPTNLLELVDEFEEGIKKKDRSVELSLIGDVKYSDIPFRHLIVVGQIAKWDMNKVFEILSRTYTIDDTARKDVERRIKYAKCWLEKFAPDNLKFEIVEKVDPTMFDEDEKRFLRELASKLNEGMNAEEIHNTIYSVAKSLQIKPSKAFQSIYKAILGKTYGPRAGYFIKMLGVDWVKRRLSEIV